jgi:hypothetical protein
MRFLLFWDAKPFCMPKVCDFSLFVNAKLLCVHEDCDFSLFGHAKPPCVFVNIFKSPKKKKKSFTLLTMFIHS